MRCEVFSAGVHMPSDIKAFKISHTSEWKLDILSPGVLPAPYCFVCPAAPQGQSKSCSHQRPEVKAYSWLQLWASTDSKQMPGQKNLTNQPKQKNPSPVFLGNFTMTTILIKTALSWAIINQEPAGDISSFFKGCDLQLQISLLLQHGIEISCNHEH